MKYSPSLSFTLLLAILSSNPQAQPTQTLAYGANLQCVENAPFRPTRGGLPQDCARALIAGFPTDVDIGHFHTGSPPDTFQLPRQAFAGTCRIAVEVFGSGPVRGSWSNVWTMASALSTACTYWRVDRDASSAVTAGSMREGGNSGLVVTMRRWDPASPRANESDVANE